MTGTVEDSSGSLTVDKRLAEARRFRGSRVGLEFLIQIATWLLLFVVISLASDRDAAFDLRLGLLAGVIAASLTLLKFLAARRLEKLGELELARRAAQASRWTGPMWRQWTLLLGLGMALAVGLPIGGLLAFEDPPTDLIGGSRLATIVSWVGLSLFWAIPAAFAIRFKLSLHRGHAV